MAPDRIPRLDELEPIARGIALALLAARRSLSAEEERIRAGAMTGAELAARAERLRQVRAARRRPEAGHG